MTPKAALSTFLIFLVGGLAVTAAVFTLWAAADVVWVDFLHKNPYRTRDEAIQLLLRSPLNGVAATFVLMLGSLLIGAAIAALGLVLFRRVPLWLLVVTLPLCALATRAQGSYLLGSGGEPASLVHHLIRFSAYQLPAVILCWLWHRNRPAG